MTPCRLTYNMKKLIILMSLLAVSCISTSAVSIGQSFSLRIGETVNVDRGKLALTFVAVTRDSRCPKGVDCIVAGEGVVVFSARVTNGPSTDLTFKVTLRKGATNQFQGYAITIKELSPYPVYNKLPIKPADYSTMVLVEQY